MRAAAAALSSAGLRGRVGDAAAPPPVADHGAPTGPPPRLLAPRSAACSTAAASEGCGSSAGSSGSAGLRSLVGLLPTPMGSAASRDFLFSSEDGGSSIGGGVSRTDPPHAAEAAKDSSAAAGQWDDWDDATSDVSESGRSLESGAPGGGGGGGGGGASGVGCSGGSSARSLADGGGCSVAMLRVLQAADDTRVSLGLPPAPAGSRL